jgi:S1-C subfamily serine protease
MQKGDILLKLDRAAVYDVADIWTFTRARPAGDEVEATYIRGRDMKKGTGRLSRFEDYGE